jgi:hypothetical protein
MEISMTKRKIAIIMLILIFLSFLKCQKEMESSVPSKIKYKSDFTHIELERINPILVIDDTTLMNIENYKESMAELTNTLASLQVIVLSSSGFRFNPDVSRGFPISVVIQSGGGYVSLGKALIVTLIGLRRSGIMVTCYVSEAQSMAFTAMVVGCTKVVAKRSVVLMEHRVSIGGEGSTPNTFMNDIEFSKIEARKIGVNWEDWIKIARGEKDHVFTKEEIEKYKLVNDWMD